MEHRELIDDDQIHLPQLLSERPMSGKPRRSFVIDVWRDIECTVRSGSACHQGRRNACSRCGNYIQPLCLTTGYQSVVEESLADASRALDDEAALNLRIGRVSSGSPHGSHDAFIDSSLAWAHDPSGAIDCCLPSALLCGLIIADMTTTLRVNCEVASSLFLIFWWL
jgi:hypothetical protein